MGNFDNYYRDNNGNVHRDIPLGTSPADAYVRTNMKLKKEVEQLTNKITETNEHIDSEISRMDEAITYANTAAKTHLENAVEDINQNISDTISALNQRIDNIISAVTTDTEVTDIRNGAEGLTYRTAGIAVREQFASADRKINSLKKGLLGVTDSELSWSQGALNTSTGEESSTNWEIRTAYFQTVSDVLIIKVQSGYYARLFTYTDEDTFAEYHQFNQNTVTTVPVSTSSKYRLTLRSLSSTISVGESDNLKIYEDDITESLRQQSSEIQDCNRKTDDTLSILNAVLESDSYIFPIEWEVGGFYNATGEKDANSQALRSSRKINVKNLSRKIDVRITGEYNSSLTIKYYTYDNDGNYLGVVSSNNPAAGVTLNNDVAYIHFYVTDYSTSTSVDYCDGIIFYTKNSSGTLNDCKELIQKNNDSTASVINAVLESGSYMFPIEWEIGTFDNSTGEKTFSSNTIRSAEKINVKNLSRQVYLSIEGQYSPSPVIRYYTYNNDGNYLGYITASASLKGTTLDDDVAYINVYVSDYATSVSTDYCEGIFFYTKKSSTIITRCADQIENIAAGCASDRHTFGKKNFALLMFSDLHSDMERMKNAIELLNSCDLIDAAINLGDTCGSEPSASGFANYVSITNTASKPLLTVMGNHDERVYENTDITVEDCVESFIALTDEAECYSERGYGYKDFDNYKIRIIILNNFDYPNNQDSLGKYIYYGYQPMYLQEQTDWLIETLNSVPENYTVIVAGHITEPVQCDEMKIPQHLSTLNRSNVNAVIGTCGFMSDTVIADIIEAYRNKTSLTKSYTYSRQTANVTGVEVDADFSDAKGEFACYICGHTHNQAIGRIHNHENQVVYFNDSSRGLINNSSWTQASSLVPRTREGRAQDLLTVLCVDTENKNLNFIRIGAHLSMYMEDYNILSYPYQ